MKIGMIFPGQGSQFVGMGKTFFDNERVVQELFDEASNCLSKNFVKLCFASSEAELMETVNAQTSIFLVSASIFTLLKQKYNISPSILAGHSLGEYSAIFAGGGFSFPDGLYLLTKRASFMAEATCDDTAGMLAVLNFPQESLEDLVKRHNIPGSDDAVVEIVNYNSSTQFVLSGTLKELDLIAQDINLSRGKAIKLKVAGAFHSRLMNKAQLKFSAYLEKVDFLDLSTPLVSNVDTKEIKAADEIRFDLVRQISSPVLWWQSMQRFKDCDFIIEVGPGTKLSKTLSREWPLKKIFSINEPRDIENLLEAIEAYKAD